MGDADPGVSGAPADHLKRRAAAAARAFAALNLDAPDGDVGAGIAEADTAAGGGTGTAEPDVAVGPDADGPGASGAGAGGEGPLRPDAVFHDFPMGAEARTSPPRTRGRGDGGQPWTDPPPPGDGRRSEAPAEGSPRLAATTGTTAAAGTAAARRAATTGTTAAAADRPEFDPPAREVDRHLLDLGAGAVATGAFVSPVAWLGVVAAGVAAGVIARSLIDHGVDPARLVRRVRSSLHARSLVRFAVLLARGAALAVLVPAVVCALVWMVRYGRAGMVAAARAGVWTHSLRFAVVLACYALIAGTGETRERRIARLQRITARMSGSSLALAAAAAVIVAVLVAAVMPRSDAWGLGHDGLGWAPESVHDQVGRLRTVIVEAELAAAVGCLAAAQRLHWHGIHERGSTAVVLVADTRPEAGDVATAAVALHNQMAPWIETVHVVTTERALLVVDRTELSTAVPLAGPSALRDAAITGRALVEDGMADFDKSVALDCSVAPVL